MRRRIVRRRPYRRFRKPFAKVRRTWVTSAVPTVCNQIDLPATSECVEPPGSGTNKARIVLVDQTLLEDKFSDRATVKRVVGDLWFGPTYDGTTPSNCATSYLAALDNFVQMFIGMRKLQSNAAGENLPLDPLASDFDYSEGEWLRTWQHIWFPEAELNFIAEHDVVNCTSFTCPDVHTTGLPDNDFVDGTGTVDIETTCSEPITQTCTTTQPAVCNATVKFPRPWHVHFDVKKSVPLREFEELVLDVDFLWPFASLFVNPRVQFLGGIKCLLQY